MIAIIDYGIGNLKSVHNAVRYIAPKTPSKVSSDPDFIYKADKVIFPGQGAMPDCIKELDKRGIRDVVIESAKKKPFLGICLGLQLLFEKSEEGDVDGFGIFEGRIKKFQPNKQVRIKIPHMGWNDVTAEQEHPLLQAGEAYYLHGYHFAVADKAHLLATTHHGMALTAAVGHDNIIGVQFHPEKSQAYGLSFLHRFLEWKP